MTYATYLINNNIKRVGEKLGIKGITFYSARHSYASNLYHNNVPIGLIAQNMGRNTAEIETYLKEFEDENIIKANKLSYLTEQPEYKDAAKHKPVNAKLREYFAKKKAEEDKLLEKYGGEEAFREMIKKQQQDLKKELTEKFGNDTAAKIAYLQKKRWGITLLHPKSPPLFSRVKMKKMPRISGKWIVGRDIFLPPSEILK